MLPWHARSAQRFEECCGLQPRRSFPKVLQRHSGSTEEYLLPVRLCVAHSTLVI